MKKLFFAILLILASFKVYTQTEYTVYGDYSQNWPSYTFYTYSYFYYTPYGIWIYDPCLSMWIYEPRVHWNIYYNPWDSYYSSNYWYWHNYDDWWYSQYWHSWYSWKSYSYYHRETQTTYYGPREKKEIVQKQEPIRQEKLNQKPSQSNSHIKYENHNVKRPPQVKPSKPQPKSTQQKSRSGGK